ncbi:uncharacterized protein [Miscanthus floridulus]|uniref:uncharacterized protein n=1 Tax=Miscanthus floridulus TaxID=154761 RepID=UPI003458750F
MVLIRDAIMIFATMDSYLRGPDAHKRSSVLESFPQSFEFIPWRRVYKQVAVAESATAHPTMDMEHWEASDLSFGGVGSLWCFTELQRSGENVSRKTEDGQTWMSKSGRAPKNGFPDQIRVDKLVITRKDFHMIELTLNQEKPIIALCKIWRKGNSAAASPQTPKPSVFSPGASTSSLRVFEDHFLVHDQPTEMQIDQFQGQMEAIAPQQYMPDDHELPIIGGSNIVTGCITSSSDADSTYQEEVSFLYRMKESFKQVAIHRKEEARWIASAVQNAASTLKNTLKLLGINAEPENTWPCTSNTPVMEPAVSSAANHAGLAPEMMAQGEFPEQPYSMEEMMAQGEFQSNSTLEDSYFVVGNWDEF